MLFLLLTLSCAFPTARGDDAEPGPTMDFLVHPSYRGNAELYNIDVLMKRGQCVETFGWSIVINHERATFGCESLAGVSASMEIDLRPNQKYIFVYGKNGELARSVITDTEALLQTRCADGEILLRAASQLLVVSTECPKLGTAQETMLQGASGKFVYTTLPRAEP